MWMVEGGVGLLLEEDQDVSRQHILLWNQRHHPLVAAKVIKESLEMTGDVTVKRQH